MPTWRRQLRHASRLGAPVGVLGAVLAATTGTAGASWRRASDATIPVPPPSSTSVNVSVADAKGVGAISVDEVDWFRFVVPKTGSYTILALTPASGLDTVLAVFNVAGQRIAFNDDIVDMSNTDSRVTVNLTLGAVIHFGITKYGGTAPGAYQWAVDRPK